MQKTYFNDALIAPCGMNCGVCIAYLREKKPCLGCRAKDENKPKHCITCRIVHCDNLTEANTMFCFDCGEFPCRRLKQLDARYRKNYKTSLIENLNQIKRNGIGSFLSEEASKWTCTSCNRILSIHRESCLHCNSLVVCDK